MKLISKLLFLCLSLGISQALFSQTEAESLRFKQDHEDHLVCGLSKQVILEHSTPPLKILSDYTSAAEFDCGKFKVFYADLLPGAPAGGFGDPALGAERRSTLCAVLNYVESVFDLSNVPDHSIRIEVEPSWITALNPAPTTVNYYAYAGPSFSSVAPNTLVGGAVNDFINTGIDPVLSSDFHGYMKVNFSSVGFYQTAIPWLNDHTQNVSACQIDLFYVLLHEVGHILGFTSLANNDGVLSPTSIIYNNNFSKFDYLLHYSSNTNFTATNLQKLISGGPTSATLNSTLSSVSITDNRFWITGSAAPNNHPVYSGGYTGSYNEKSLLHHLDEQPLSYSFRSRNAPGYAEGYVMGPYGIIGADRRNFTDPEIKIFIELGYALNPSYSNPNLNNLPPYSATIGSDPDYTKGIDNFQSIHAETVEADETIINDVGVSFTFNLWEDVGIADPEGEPLTVADGTLTNIRGCGNGGNNHAQLTLSADKKSITFTPRANFIGRAQFAFRLFDGVKIGSWHLYTVDVQTGNNVNYPVGSNLVINGNLEEGTEVRRTGADGNKPYTSVEGMREGFMRGYHYSDANPNNIVGNGWIPYGAGDFIRNAASICNIITMPTGFGSESNSFPNTYNLNPIPYLNLGDRYGNIYQSYNYFGLGTSMQTCHKYVLKFDYANKPQLYNLNLASYPVSFGFTNDPSFPALPTLVNTFTENLVPIPVDTWMHVEIPFNYCAQTPANFLNVKGFTQSYNGLLFDNIQIVEVTNIPQLTVSITGGTSEICAGTSTTLTAVVSNQFCNPTYAWSNGMTSSSISVSPNTTQTYTVVVSDGCNSQSASIEVVVTGSYLEPISDFSVCTNTNTEIINFIGANGVDFEWTNSNPSIGLSSSGTGINIPSFLAQNTSNAVLSGTITVTPPSINGCVGVPISFTISVGNTQPVVNTISDYNFCSNININSINFSGTAGTSYSWTNSNPSIGLPSSGTGTSLPSFITQNNYDSPITASITVTPTLTGCVGNIVIFDIIVLPLPAIDNISDQTICASNYLDEINFTGAPSGTIFSWTNSNPSIGLNALGTGNSISSFTVQNTSNVPEIATVIVTATIDGCTSASTSFTITVNPLPVLSPIADQTLCANGSTSLIEFIGLSGTTYTWTNTNNSTGLSVSGNGNNIAAFVAANNSSNPIFSEVTVTPEINGCIGNSTTFTITVNPLPVIDPIADQTICEKTFTDIVNFNSSIIGTTFEWTNSNPSIGLAASGSGSSIESFITENPTSDNISSTVTIIPTSPAGCVGNSISFNYNINIQPEIQSISNVIVCNGELVNSISFSGNSNNIVYSWTNSNTSIGAPASGTGDFPSFTATNDDVNGNSISSTVTVTPTLNGCVGNVLSFAITVNSDPILDPIVDQEFCSNMVADINDFSTIPSGSSFTWTSSNAAIGLATSGSGNIPLFNAINASTVPITSTITVTPTLNGCEGGAVSFLVTIKPTPKIDPVSNQTLCANAITSAINFTGTAGATFDWENSNTTIGLAASGIGNIASFTATNNSNAPNISFISATATLNGCTGYPTNFTITVNPNPILNPVGNQTICANTSTSPIVFSSTPSSSLYSWTNSNTAIGLAAGGFGDIPSFTATNSTAAAIIGVINVKAKLNECFSNIITFTITVNPLPVVTVAPPSSTIAPGASVSLAASGAINYSWSPTNGLSCTNCANTIATPAANTNYTVTGTNIWACSATATAQIVVDPALACSPCTYSLGGTLNSTPPANRTYCVISNLSIVGNVTINRSELKIAPNVTITVENGSVLTIKGSHLLACGDMWQGIVVKPTGRLVIEDYQLPIWPLTVTNSLIEDAVIAVDITSNTLNSNILRLKNVVFNRNQYGVHVSQYNQNISAYPFSIENCIFTSRLISSSTPVVSPTVPYWPTTASIRGGFSGTNNNFGSVYITNNANATLKAPNLNQLPTAGLFLENVGLTLNVGIDLTPIYREFVLGSALSMTIFDNHNRGVWLESSNFTSINTVYQNLPKAGIYANANEKNNRLQVIPVLASFVGNNRFVDCGKAINTINYFENLIQYCDVRSSQLSSGTFKLGIEIATNRNRTANISNNTIYNVSRGIYYNATIGSLSIPGLPSSGQVAGDVIINLNTIRPGVTTPLVANRFVSNAIILQNSGTNQPLTLTGNNQTPNIRTFGNTIYAYRGISYSNWIKQNVQSQNNNITLIAYPSFAQNSSYVGILVQNGVNVSQAQGLLGENNYIRNNNVNFTSPSTANNYPLLIGIGVELNGAIAVTCNNTNGTRYGIAFSGNNSPSLFRNNTMQNHTYGFTLAQNGIIGTQGAMFSPSDNRWLGTWPSSTYKTLVTNNSYAQASPLWVRNYPTYTPNGSSFSANPFSISIEYRYSNNNSLFQSPLAPPTLNLACFVPFSFLYMQKSLENVALDSIVYSNDLNGLGEKMRYIAKNMLYQTIKQDSVFKDSSTVLADFYNSSINTAREKIYEIQKHLSVGNLFEATLKNASLVPVNNIEENYKKYHEIYINYLQQGSASMADSIDLKAIAEKCPFSDGSVIYQARALYNTIFKTYQIFENNCPADIEAKSMFVENETQTGTPSGLILYPNPAQNEMFIQTEKVENTNILVNITDAGGKIVFSSPVIEVAAGLAKIDLDLINGIYFVHINNLFTNEKVIQKLVIQK